MTRAAEAAPHLLVEGGDGIVTLTLNRPDKHNALSPEMVCRLADAWDAIAADPTTRVAVVTGAGDRAFCTGADLGRLIPLFTGARPPDDEWDERLRSDLRLLDKALLRRADFTVPVVAAVRGFALAGGTELVLGTDLRIAADDAEFGLTEVARGIIPAGGGLARLARQVPWAKAAEVVLVGDRISARDALAWAWSTASCPPPTSSPSPRSWQSGWRPTGRWRCARPRRSCWPATAVPSRTRSPSSPAPRQR